MQWICISATVSASAGDAFAEELRKASALSVSFSATGSERQETLEPDSGQMPLWESLKISGLFTLDTELTTVRNALTAASASDIETEFLTDMDLERFSKPKLGPMKFGKLLVAPRDYGDSFDGPVVWLDPGLAFGTGRHPTTELCLRWLSAMPLSGKSVLDVGCGSGILGIAAAKLGAKRVAGIDRDLQAIRASATNAEFNGVSMDLATFIPKNSTFDIIVANILSETLIELSDVLTRATVHGGAIALCGILTSQVDNVRSVYAEFEFNGYHSKDNWVLLSARRVSFQ